MADRSVTIKLELDTAQLDRVATEAALNLLKVDKSAKAAGDRLDQLNRQLGETNRAFIVATVSTTAFDAALEETEKRVKGLATQLGDKAAATYADRMDKVEAALKKVQSSTKDTTTEQEKLGKKTEETSRQFEKASNDSTMLGAALRAARARVNELATEFENTGSEKSLKGLRAARSEVRALEQDIKNAVREGGGGGGGFGFSLTGAFGRGIGSILNISPEFAVIASGIGAALAPLIGAAINGALIAGGGLSGIGLGIVGQLHSPIVTEALSGFAHDFRETLTESTQGFAQPFAAALGTIGNSLNAAIENLDLDNLAKEIQPLADGIAGLITEMGPGLKEALDASGPILKILADELPSIGHALSDFFHEVANSHGTMEGFRITLVAVEEIIEVLGHVLGALGNALDFVLKAAEKTAAVLSKIPAFDVLRKTLDWVISGSNSLDRYAISLVTVSNAGDGSVRVFKGVGHALSLVTDQTQAALKETEHFSETIGNVADGAIPAKTALELYGAVADGVADSSLNAAQQTGLFTDILGRIEHTAGSASDHMSTMVDVFNDIAKAELSASDKANLLSKAWDDMYGPEIKLNEANERYHKSLLDIAGTYEKDSKGVAHYQGSLDEHSRSLDINTKAGLKNRDAIEEAATSLHALFLMDLQETNSMEEATRRDELRRQQLIKTTTQTGLNRKEVEQLVNQYDRIPPSKNTTVTVTPRNFETIFNELRNTLVAQHMLMHPGETRTEALRTSAEWLHAAQGGPITGSGGKKQDNIPIWASAGEFMHQAEAVDYYGLGVMNALNERRVPKEVLLRLGNFPEAGYASGGLIPWQEMGRYAKGMANWAPNWPIIVDLGKTKIPSADPWANWDGTMTPMIATAMSFLRAQSGKPYGWAQAGPWAYDCSGIVSAVWNLLHGRAPYNHTFSTSDEGRYFPIGGGGGVLTAGWANPGERGGGSVGHTAAVLAGQPFESTGSQGVHLSGVTSLGSFAHIGHFDSGGYMAPGWNLSYNGTGRLERVQPPRGQFVSGGGGVTVIKHEHHIVIEGTGVLRGLRREIRAAGGDVQEVLGQ